MTGVNRRQSRPWLLLAALVIAVIATLVIVPWIARDTDTAEPAPNEAPGVTGVIERPVDGDTLLIRVDGVTLRVRLLNIDTPETKKESTPVECMGPEAAARLSQLAPPGATVELGYDVERIDQYGRTLARVTLADGRIVSEVLAEEGLGEAVLFRPNGRDYQLVLAAEDRAQRAGLGLYSGVCD